MSVSTRTGDDGFTSLIYGRRVPKNHPRVQAYGAVDELSSTLGLCRVHCEKIRDREFIREIQQDLIALMGELATDDLDQERYLAQASHKLEAGHLERLDAEVAQRESLGEGFRGWILPGENTAHAFLDIARTTCRRAERHCYGLQAGGGAVRPLILRYLNRLADILWLMGRDTIG